MRRLSLTFAAVLLALALTGCVGTAEAAKPPKPTRTPSPTATVSPTPSPTTAPPTTPPPSTTTPAPSTTAPGDPQPNGPAGTWVLDWADEFNGTALDTTKWACNGWTNNNMSAGSLCSNITVANGEAQLALDAGNHGAQMGTNFEYGATNGYLLPVGGVAESRVYLPGEVADCNGGVYNWGGFWTGAGSGWPAQGETDVVEVLGGQASTNYHGTTNSLNGPKPAGCWSNAWHTYTVHRKATTVDVYWDATLVKTFTTGDNGSGEALLLTQGYTGGTNVLGGAGALRADYVRAWHPA